MTFFPVSKNADKVLSKRTVGGAYASYWLDDVTWTDERNFTATFADTEGRWDFTIRDWSLPFVLPTLHMSYVAPRRGAWRP